LDGNEKEKGEKKNLSRIPSLKVIHFQGEGALVGKNAPYPAAVSTSSKKGQAKVPNPSKKKTTGYGPALWGKKGVSPRRDATSSVHRLKGGGGRKQTNLPEFGKKRRERNRVLGGGGGGEKGPGHLPPKGKKKRNGGVPACRWFTFC